MNTRAARPYARKDYTNIKINYLTAISSTDNKYGKEFLWNWRCDCGKVVQVRPSQIKAGRKKSCGCMQSILVDKAKRLPDGEAAFRQLYRAYRNSAKNRNLDFNLTIDEFKILTKKSCFYCGEVPFQKYIIKSNNTAPYTYNGVDRLNNYMGYFTENCVPCCGRCNSMKGTLPVSNFMDAIESIYKNRKLFA